MVFAVNYQVDFFNVCCLTFQNSNPLTHRINSLAATPFVTKVTMTDFNSSAESSLFSSEDTVFIKQEVVPPAYLSEGDDEGGLGNWNGNMRGQQDSDSDEEAEADSVEEGSTVSDDEIGRASCRERV